MDDEPDDEPDVVDDGVEELAGVDDVDVLEVVSDEDVDPPSFLPSPEPAAAGVEALLAVARESVL